MSRRRKISPRWPGSLYRWCMRDWPKAELDFSEEAAWACYLWESEGQPKPDATNGFMWGKHWLGVFINQWKEGIREGLFLPSEILQDVPEEHRAYVQSALQGASKPPRIVKTWTNPYLEKA